MNVQFKKLNGKTNQIQLVVEVQRVPVRVHICTYLHTHTHTHTHNDLLYILCVYTG
jgi:hypothetical protein